MVKKNFQDVDLGDRRRVERLIEAAATIARRPEHSFTLSFDLKGLRAFYRLCNCKKATLKNIQASHWNLTRQAMGEQPIVLILHDTSELDYTSHHALKGAGPIGDGNGRGFLQHNSLAVVPGTRQVLGLAYQQIVTRKPAPKKETSYQRRKRKRESQLWMDGIRASGRPPVGSMWVDVGDRGADIYEAMRESEQVGHHFVIRACQDRGIGIQADLSETSHLMQFAASLPSLGTDTIEIPSRKGRPARTATVQLSAAPIWVPAPKGTKGRKSQPVIRAWVVRVWEVNPPAGGEPLQWVMVTSVPTTTLAEAQERRDWYARRWMVEEFHRIEKSGCGEEDRRFETAARMIACLAILAVVAVRVFQLRTALDAIPDAPAAAVGTQEEIAVLDKQRPKKNRIVTVRDFVMAVGRLGGHLGRKGDGPPGTRALWIGYQRLQDMVLGYQARHQKAKEDVGNR